MSENVEVLANWLKVNWSGKWVTTTPTFIRAPYNVEQTFRSGTNYILYEPLEFVQFPASLNKEWWNYYLSAKFTLIGSSLSVVADMFNEVSYIRNKFFYAAPWYPQYDASQSETLCHLNCNEGTGTEASDSTTNYDFTFAAASADPSWGTDGTIYGPNYINLDSNDYMTTSTLLDVAPSALTIEAVLKTNDITSGSYVQLCDKQNIASPLTSIQILASNAGVVNFFKTIAGVGTNLGRTLALSKWHNIMVTYGPRGQEIFLNGVETHYSASTTVMANGTAADFYIGAHGSAATNLHLCRFRVSNVQRLPFDSLSTPQFKSIDRSDSGADTYKTDIYLTGTLKSVYLGRPSYG